MRDGFSVEVYQHDWIPGFAAFRNDDAIHAEGKAHVVLNLGSILAMVKCGDMDPSEVPYFVAESIMHEVIHALEAWADVEFNEDRVVTLCDEYTRKYMEEASRQPEG